MTKAAEWLKEYAPGYNNLSRVEQDAIVGFSFLWSLFESRILNARGNAIAICEAVDTWHREGLLEADLFDPELEYFANRYYADNGFTYHFKNLNFKRRDREPLVRGVLDGTDADVCHRAAAALIIVYRYRNNLFHGVKWEYELAGQLDNFNNANTIIMKALSHYGKLLP